MDDGEVLRCRFRRFAPVAYVVSHQAGGAAHDRPTPWRDPRVIVALVGPVRTTVVVVGLLAVLAGAFLGIRRLKRRRTARTTAAAA